jgi:hypothetical protein
MCAAAARAVRNWDPATTFKGSRNEPGLSVADGLA